jgi:hypothetical protein
VVAEELLFNGKASLPSGTAVLVYDVRQVDGEGVEEPQEDDIVHRPPAKKGQRQLQCQQDEVAPTGVVVEGDVEDDGDHGPDVLDIDGLGVEAGDGGCLEHVVGTGEERCHQWSHEAATSSCS